MFSAKLVEGHERPGAIGNAQFDEHGKTSGLLLRMLKSYFGSGKYVILDSGFCVLKGIVELHRHGLFACALIKKCRYWPTHVPGDVIDSHMSQCKVGTTDAIKGTLDGIQ